MRLGGRLRGVAPLARRLIDSAVGSVDSWMTGKLGEEFNERLARVPLNLTATGIDEFGLDPQWTKYALASVAFLHRKYFRTEAGGSNEVILFNNGADAYGWGKGSETVGAVNETLNIRKTVVTDPAYQGSYNYSETSQEGLDAHEKRDVKPHVAGRNFYVNPKDPYSPLELRTFPRLDMEGKPLADQV